MNPQPPVASVTTNRQDRADGLDKKGRSPVTVFLEEWELCKQRKAAGFEEIRRQGWLELVKELIRRFREDFERNIDLFCGEACNHLYVYLEEERTEIITDLCRPLPSLSPLDVDCVITELRTAIHEAVLFSKKLTELKAGRRHVKPYMEVWDGKLEMENFDRHFELRRNLEKTYEAIARLQTIASKITPTKPKSKRVKAGRKLLQENDPTHQLYLEIRDKLIAGMSRREIIEWMRLSGIPKYLKKDCANPRRDADRIYHAGRTWLSRRKLIPPERRTK